MNMPKELDVPHWAIAMVNNHRSKLSLPERVTNRMIFARLQETKGMMPEDEEEMVRSLIEETADGGDQA